MPEMPEVETVRRQLRDKILNREIDQVIVGWEKTVGYDEQFADKLIGRKFTDIDRIGKLLIFVTDDPNLFLLGHLKMTGQFLFAEGARATAGGGHTLQKSDLDLPNKHTHVQLHFTDDSVLYFNDMRKFGYVRAATADEVMDAKAGYGIEPGTDNYTQQAFMEIFGRRTAPIKGLLLNQKLVSGLGNIYVDEALFCARVRPDRRADTLTESEKKALYAAIYDVLTEAVAAGGTTFYSFKDSHDQEGNYYNQLQVFDRTGEPCRVCNTSIEKTRVAGRGTHFCPTCQG